MIVYDNTSSAITDSGAAISGPSGTPSTAAGLFTLGSSALVHSIAFPCLSILPGKSPAPPTSLALAWAIYTDASGSPGSVVASGSVTATLGAPTRETDSEIVLRYPDGTIRLIIDSVCFTHLTGFTIPPTTLVAGTYWVSLEDTTDTGTAAHPFPRCWQMASAGGANHAASSTGSGWTLSADTVAFTLTDQPY